MPSNPTHTTRRRFLASFLSLAAAPAEGFSLFGKTKAQNLGKVYEYLQDVDLRIKETGSQRITIKNIIFSGEKFDGEWGNFDFVGCEFSSSFFIQLKWLVKCTFTNCHFRGIFNFGNARNVKFTRCTVVVDEIGGITFSSRSTGLAFEGCTFSNSNYDLNHEGGVLCVGEISFIDCKAEGFALGGDKKLALRRCTTRSARLATAYSGEYSDKSLMPYSDFLLEDCDFTGGVRTTNLKLNNFTMRNCEVGIFETARSVVRGNMLIENIKKGHFDLSRTDFQGKLTVKDCSFFRLYDGHSFWCPSIVIPHVLLENVVCKSYPANISGATDNTTEKVWSVAKNKSTIIRNCDISHLHLDWMQTEHLRIENCEFDTLLIRNGRIGKLEIIDCSLKKLDVSNTQVKEQNIRIPKGCDTITTSSNIKPLPRE